MPQTTITLYLHDTGLLDCRVQEGDGGTVSFDPAQLPDRMKDAMGAALVSALAAKTAAETKATEAEARAAEAEEKVASVAGQLAVKEQLDAKDANIQALMAELQAKA